MKPVLPSSKRVAEFSIDSLIGKDLERNSEHQRRTENVDTANVEDINFLNRLPPMHLAQGMQHALRQYYMPGDQSGNELLALRSPWGLGGPGLHHPTNPMLSPPSGAFHSALLGAHRESLSMYPWLMARHGSYLNFHYPGKFETADEHCYMIEVKIDIKIEIRKDKEIE